MNPTIDLLLSRKSVRAYEERPISPDARDLVLAAALRAPTAGNMMLYSILEVEDQALKDRLAITCDNQPFIARAPWVLLFLADYQRWFDAYRTGGVAERCQARGEEMRRPAEGDLLLACCDALIAAHTAVVAAESLGIGSCYIGDVIEQYETHRALFDLPPYAVPIALVTFGYPTAEQVAHPHTPRFDRDFILHKDRYHRASAADVERMLAARTAQLVRNGPRQDGIENAAQFNYEHKFSAAFTVEMTRSVRAMLEAWNQKTP